MDAQNPNQSEEVKEEVKSTEQVTPIIPPVPIVEEMAKLSSLSDLLKKTLEIYKVSVWKFLGMTYLIPMLGLLPIVIVLAVYALTALTMHSSPAASIVNVILGLLGLLSVIFFIIVSVVSKAGAYLLFKNISNNPKVKDMFMEGSKLAWKFFVVNIISLFFILLWSLLLIIPGIYAGIKYSFAPWVLFFEGLDGTAAINRSKELVKGNFWWVLGMYAFLVVIVILISGISAGLHNAGLSFILQILSIVLAPAYFIFSGFMYMELVKAEK